MRPAGPGGRGLERRLHLRGDERFALARFVSDDGSFRELVRHQTFAELEFCRVLATGVFRLATAEGVAPNLGTNDGGDQRKGRAGQFEPVDRGHCPDSPHLKVMISGALPRSASEIAGETL